RGCRRRAGAVGAGWRTARAGRGRGAGTVGRRTARTGRRTVAVTVTVPAVTVPVSAIAVAAADGDPDGVDLPLRLAGRAEPLRRVGQLFGDHPEAVHPQPLVLEVL